VTSEFGTWPTWAICRMSASRQKRSLLKQGPASNPAFLALAQPSRESLEVLLAAAPQQLRKFVRIDRGGVGDIWRDTCPSFPKYPQRSEYDSNASHFAAGADSSFGTIGATGDPGPIFCKFPVMMRSFSDRPVTLTDSPSVGPNDTNFCSALPSAPTT
jgi:hypothetical protein